jgi:hypothetical protein
MHTIREAGRAEAEQSLSHPVDLCLHAKKCASTSENAARYLGSVTIRVPMSLNFAYVLMYDICSAIR